MAFLVGYDKCFDSWCLVFGIGSHEGSGDG